VHSGQCQPRPQGLLGFQYGGRSGEDPGTQQITWPKISNEDGDLFKMTATAERLEINKMAEKAEA